MQPSDRPPVLSERERLTAVLLANLRARRPMLEAVWASVDNRGGPGRVSYESLVYRFYHGSFKAFRLQSDTERVASALRAVAPDDRPFCPLFAAVIAAGTGRTFDGAATNDPLA